jgi:hypothetical protein
MARKPKLYQKLVRRRGGIGTYFSLWLASDHVLQVEANMMTEHYQRVWFRDVQGFFIRPSREARWVTWASLGLLGVFITFALISEMLAPMFWVFGSLTFIVLLYGLFLARSCHFHVVTAVQRTEWSNVARHRQARKLIARLEPLIRDAQRNEIPAMPVVENLQATPAEGSSGEPVVT